MRRNHAPFLLACCAMAMGFGANTVSAADIFRFSANRMSGSRALGKDSTVLEGVAKVISETLTLTADRIELSGDENRFVDCSGTVSGVDTEKGIRFITERLRYDRKLKIARLEGNSTLEDKKNSVVAKGRFIEYNDEGGIAILQIGVRIFKDELVCRSEWALYRREEKNLELAGMPVVFKEGDEFRADRMQVDLETDEVSMEGTVSGSLKEKSSKENQSDDGKP